MIRCLAHNIITLIFLLFLITNSSQEGVRIRICGNKLVRFFAYACSRDESANEIPQEINRVNIYPGRRDFIIDECCRKRCNPEEIKKAYCVWNVGFDDTDTL